MKTSKYDNYTDEELERIEWFKNAGPSLMEETMRTYKVIYRNVEGDAVVLNGGLND